MTSQKLDNTKGLNSPPAGARDGGRRILSARLEPFDSFWQAPKDAASGYEKFSAYYRYNYLPHVATDRNSRILVVSCGPGYLVNLLKEEGYSNVVGIDSDPLKAELAIRRGLNCKVAEAIDFLEQNGELFDVIIPEQELNHLTIDEMIDFLSLCRHNLTPGGQMIVYGLNGANPLVAAENLAHNIDHFNLFTEYSLEQVLGLAGFTEIDVIPLKLYVFWRNPLNYPGLVLTWLLETCLRGCFMLYGKDVKILSKKIAATCRNPG